MSNFGKSTFYGGIYAKDQNETTCQECRDKINCRYHKFATQLGNIRRKIEKGWAKTKEQKNNLGENIASHIEKKQELYLPVLIALLLLALVFVSKTVFAKTVAMTNNLPIKENYQIKLAGSPDKKESSRICSENDAYQKELAKKNAGDEKLREKVASIVKDTPMSAMVDAISEKPRPVAAFIVGIAMKESKFGVYSPKKNGKDCYNYWGFKGGGTTVAGGYTCFSSPEQAVEKVGGKIEKLVDRGVKSPAQMIGWKCGSSCAGHGQANVQKWISDVAVNFYKINS